jgi:hypothetical protein
MRSALRLTIASFVAALSVWKAAIKSNQSEIQSQEKKLGPDPLQNHEYLIDLRIAGTRQFLSRACVLNRKEQMPLEIV